MVLPTSVRPPRPGDGSKIAEPTAEQKRAERERERRAEHYDALVEEYFSEQEGDGDDGGDTDDGVEQ
jgi:hypothetical protein